METENEDTKRSWFGKITKNYTLNAIVAFLLWPIVSLYEPNKTVGGILFFVGVYYTYKAVTQYRHRKRMINSQNIAVNSRFCVSCGQSMEVDSKYCMSCGNKIT